MKKLLTLAVLFALTLAPVASAGTIGYADIISHWLVDKPGFHPSVFSGLGALVSFDIDTGEIVDYAVLSGGLGIAGSGPIYDAGLDGPKVEGTLRSGWVNLEKGTFSLSVDRVPILPVSSGLTVDIVITPEYFEATYSDGTSAVIPAGRKVISLQTIRTSGVPEPSGIALLGFGMLGLVRFARP